MIAESIIILIIVLFFFIFRFKNYILENKNNSFNIPIIYINLAHRVDRRKEFEKEMEYISINKYYRVNAIYDKKKPIRGCALSHLYAIKMAKRLNFPCVLICEDDFVFNRNNLPSSIKEKISQSLKECEDFDVLMLACNIKQKNHDQPIKNHVQRIKFAYSACAYIVRNGYYDDLINVYNDAINKLEPIDYTWKKLQEKDKWYCCKPMLGHQRFSYSDIEHKNVYYRFGRLYI